VRALSRAFGRAPDEPARTRVTLAADRCTGCAECLAVCTAGAITLLPDDDIVRVASSRCGGCRRCVPVCPCHAIAVSGPTRTRHHVVLDCLQEALARRCPGGWRVTAAEPLPRTSPPPDVPGLDTPDLETPDPCPPELCTTDLCTTDLCTAGGVAPDVAVLRTPAPALDWLPDPHPPVALVVEVVTRATRRRDLEDRRKLYQDNGIPAYWTVDAASGRVTVHWSRTPAWFDPLAGALFG
jgi:Pyruvate/2-oxoacid:ferredoxin oxidoreductase delta subunit